MLFAVTRRETKEVFIRILSTFKSACEAVKGGTWAPSCGLTDNCDAEIGAIRFELLFTRSCAQAWACVSAYV